MREGADGGRLRGMKGRPRCPGRTSAVPRWGDLRRRVQERRPSAV